MNTQVNIDPKAFGQAAALALDEKWLVEHGYKQVTQYLWTRRGWPRVTRAIDGRWVHVPPRGPDNFIYRQTARELVQDILFMRDAAARAAWDKAQARWDEALQ